MVLWSVAGFSVHQQTAPKTRCRCTLMGPAARNAGVSISSRLNYGSQTCETPLCSSAEINLHK